MAPKNKVHPVHPSGITVDLVGIKSSDRGRSCEEHACCGSVVKIDTVVRIRAEQVEVNGREDTAMVVYWVTDGIDRCRVGFLPRHTVKHKASFDGKLAQIVEILGESDSPADRKFCHRNHGAARAVIINAESPPSKKVRSAEEDNVSDEDPYTTPDK